LLLQRFAVHLAAAASGSAECARCTVLFARSGLSMVAFNRHAFYYCDDVFGKKGSQAV
jgi:hypothetical protein